MKKKLMEILACPKCKGPLTLKPGRTDGEDIIEGMLHCPSCDTNYVIEKGVPHFVVPGLEK